MDNLNEIRKKWGNDPEMQEYLVRLDCIDDRSNSIDDGRPTKGKKRFIPTSHERNQLDDQEKERGEVLSLIAKRNQELINLGSDKQQQTQKAKSDRTNIQKIQNMNIDTLIDDMLCKSSSLYEDLIYKIRKHKKAPSIQYLLRKKYKHVQELNKLNSVASFDSNVEEYKLEETKAIDQCDLEISKEITAIEERKFNRSIQVTAVWVALISAIAALAQVSLNKSTDSLRNEIRGEFSRKLEESASDIRTDFQEKIDQSIFEQSRGTKNQLNILDKKIENLRSLPAKKK